ncbi:hypothetical protein [Salinibacterium sp. SWN248]|uniref:hypothetical protein n=1 Tax=Salinibacterium sp. SWN248 TaxID=2792056 RepID=UPI0018CFBFBF|nr:hypothetical protein [Salinibacterium sp. SWN248]MBH0024757.1 hypothetical protein [Salinibacterium sp. SWN248]
MLPLIGLFAKATNHRELLKPEEGKPIDPSDEYSAGIYRREPDEIAVISRIR